MDTSQRRDFIQKNFPLEVFEVYEKLQIGAAQADFWRVLVLQRFGGVYMDIDAHLVWPLESILDLHSEELFLSIKTGEISNYFIASKPSNPNLEELIEQIIKNIRFNSSANIYDLTGPGVFTKILSRKAVPTRYYLVTCNQGNFTNEYFQYIDKAQGKWTKEQQTVAVVKKTDN